MNIIMDEIAIQRAISRISFEIIEKNKGTYNLILVGIVTRGQNIAEKIAKRIFEIEGKKISVYSVNIRNFRDDIKLNYDKEYKFIDENINNKTVILVDDVISTGRSARAAIDAVFSQGRPSKIQLVSLIDRGHRELPIKVDYVGKNVPTSKNEKIKVQIKEIDNLERVIIEK